MMHRCALLLVLLVAAHAGEARPGRNGGSQQPIQTTTASEVPVHPFDLILARPTAHGVTVSVLCYEDAEGCIIYGTGSGPPSTRTATRSFKKGEPAEIVLTGLQADTRYVYRLHTARMDGEESSFHTARPPGSTFTCTITADSHLDEHTEPATYLRTLANALADAPDFHLDLGDTFMTEKHANRDNAFKQYLAQRYYFGQLCRSAPFMFVIGNHDGESPRGRDSEADSLAVWSNLTRKRYFPNPVPDDFYSGDAYRHPAAGLLQDYYAFTWGDAQFVVLDPFWFCQKQRGGSDNWKKSLGSEQYQWLKHTLEASTARFRFIFIHHLVGGFDNQCRGGADAAPLFEWGGRSADGSEGFNANRPGWGLPIHQLLVQNHVSIVFHGHDHLFAREERDGIIYQESPQPGDPHGNLRNAGEYGYKNGIILPSSGHLRLTVSSRQATVAYVHPDRSVVHSYSIPPRP